MSVLEDLADGYLNDPKWVQDESDVLETIQKAIRLCEASPSMPEKVKDS